MTESVLCSGWLLGKLGLEVVDGLLDVVVYGYVEQSRGIQAFGLDK